MLRRDATRISLSNNEISDLIKTLEVRKFEEKMRATRLKNQDKHNDIPKRNSFGIPTIDVSSFDMPNNSIPEKRSNKFLVPMDQSLDASTFGFQDSPVNMGNDINGNNLVISHGSTTDNNRSSLSSNYLNEPHEVRSLSSERNFSASSNILASSNDQDISNMEVEEMGSTLDPNPFYQVDE